MLTYFILLFYLTNVNYCKTLKKNNFIQKIVGGVETNIAQHPYLAALIKDTRIQTFMNCLCGGSILNKRYILTAGHCITNADNQLYNPERLRVLLGSNKCYNFKGGSVYLIKKFILHPKFVMKSIGNLYYDMNDIGLIYLDKDIEYQDNIQPIPLLTPEYLGNKLPVQVVGSKCIAMGWGLHKENALTNPPDLYHVEIPLLSSSLCQQVMRIYDVIINSSNVVCTLDAQAKKDVCNGDSGGPLVCSKLQIGIVSGSMGCARKNMPNVWTRVDRYIDWITEVIYHKKKSKKKSKQLVNNANNAFNHICFFVILFKIYF